MTDDHRPSPRVTALVLAVLCLLGAGLAVGLSPAVAAHDDHAPDGAPTADGDPDAPAPPSVGERVGVLGLDGRPLVDVDGQPLEVPLEVAAPDLPDTGPDPTLPPEDDLSYPTGDPAPTEDVAVVPLLDAHVRTVTELARRLGHDGAGTVALYAANGLLAPADPAGQGVVQLRALLAGSADHAASGDQPAACAALAAAGAATDGVAPDLVGGLAAPAVADLVDALGRELPC